MSVLNYQQPISKNMQMIDTFGGLNKRFRIAENEFSDILNMTSDDYPVLSTRKARKYLRYNDENTGVLPSTLPKDTSSIVFVDDVPAVLCSSGQFYYKNESVLIKNCKNNKLLRIGNILYAYPSGILIYLPKSEEDKVSYVSTEVKLFFGEQYSEENNYIYEKISFYPANSESYINGCSFFNSNETYKTGDYCWRETDKGYVLERYCGEEKGWEGMISSLIKVEIVALLTPDGFYTYADKFNVGDVVFISGTNEMDSAYVVEYVDKTAIYLQGSIDVIKEYDSGIIERRMPELDFVVEHNGRLWGCRSGYSSLSDGQYVNEIYSSALNSFTSWYKFQGTSQDSYAASVTSNGKFTGVAVIGGYITFFKERCVHRIYGSLPENFQLFTTDCDGIQEGFEESIVTINGSSYYKSPVGVMIMNEGLPERISYNLGDDNFINGFAGTDGHKYYLFMTDLDNKSYIYIYDTITGIWHKENCSDSMKFFVNFRNSLYIFSSEHILSKKLISQMKNKIIELEKLIAETTSIIVRAFAKGIKTYLSGLIANDTIGTGELICLSDNSKARFPQYFNDSEINIDPQGYFEYEEDIEWSFTTGNIGYSFYTKKYLGKIVGRLLMAENSRAEIEIEYNNDGVWYPIKSYIGDGNMKSQNISIIPSRCDTFKIRFRGIGEVKLLNLVYIFEEGSDK